LNVVDQKDTDVLKNVFHIQIEKISKQVVCQTPDEKTEWMKSIQKAKDYAEKKQIFWRSFGRFDGKIH